MPKLFMVVNEDRFFLSHRKDIALAAVKEGYDVTIIAKDTGSLDAIKKLGLKVLELPINPTGMNLVQEWHTFNFLLSLYHRDKPDIVHHVGLKNILWGGFAGRIAKVPGIVNAVSGLGGLFNDNHISLMTHGVLATMKYSNRRPGVKVIFQNNDDLEIMRRYSVVCEEQIEFTKGSGVDLKEYAYCSPPQKGPLKIIFTGRMVKEKGVLDLIAAAELLRNDFEDSVQFLLCGRTTPNKSGLSLEELQSLCDNKYICYLGERNDVKELLAQSHIMAFPSYYREGVPRSLIEASAVGRPIVTCDSTGCRDVVDEGINGFKIKPRDVKSLSSYLRKLIISPELREKMGRAAREKAEKEFSIDKVVETHLRIYRELSK
ncbi:MAG: glycosyltransferase family 4 protein [Bacteroides sp.]|nr:glycosyltransferase family 4 protein [Bacteroides sp.]